MAQPLKQNFIAKLYAAASNPDNAGKLYFSPDGRSIHIGEEGRRTRFLKDQLGFVSYQNLTRNLNYYGFSNVQNSAKAEVKIYAHPNFTRDDPQTSHSLKRNPTQRKRNKDGSSVTSKAAVIRRIATVPAAAAAAPVRQQPIRKAALPPRSGAGSRPSKYLLIESETEEDDDEEEDDEEYQEEEEDEEDDGAEEEDEEEEGELDLTNFYPPNFPLHHVPPPHEQQAFDFFAPYSSGSAMPPPRDASMMMFAEAPCTWVTVQQLEEETPFRNYSPPNDFENVPADKDILFMFASGWGDGETT